jgi:hypothetical protein
VLRGPVIKTMSFLIMSLFVTGTWRTPTHDSTLTKWLIQLEVELRPGRNVGLHDRGEYEAVVQLAVAAVGLSRACFH